VTLRPVPGIHVSAGDGYTVCRLGTFGTNGEDWALHPGGGSRLASLARWLQDEYSRTLPRCPLCYSRTVSALRRLMAPAFKLLDLIY
jgi:hypothetical protein